MKTIAIQATFSDAVIIAAGTAPSLPLTIGSTTRTATAAATNTASTTHNFRYTVVAADADTNGIQVLTAATLSPPGPNQRRSRNVMTATALPDTLNSDQSGHGITTIR